MADETKPAPKRMTFWGEREEPVVQGKGEAERRAAEKLLKRQAEQEELAKANAAMQAEVAKQTPKSK